jgi:uncharacterized protein
MNNEARQLIAALRLEPLPREGGFFRVSWRGHGGSAIYYLMTAEDFSALHRIAQDEVWNFYAGDPVEHVQLDSRHGNATQVRLGPAILSGDRPQVHIRAGEWQGARLVPDTIAHGWTLLVCTVWPPWDARGFELGVRAELLGVFPQHASWIHALTR